MHYSASSCTTLFQSSFHCLKVRKQSLWGYWCAWRFRLIVYKLYSQVIDFSLTFLICQTGMKEWRLNWAKQRRYLSWWEARVSIHGVSSITMSMLFSSWFVLFSSLRRIRDRTCQLISQKSLFISRLTQGTLCNPMI